MGDVIDDPKIVPYLRSRIGSGDILILEPHTRGLENWIAYLEDRKGAPLDIRIRALADPNILLEYAEEEAKETIEVELQIEASEEVTEVVVEATTQVIEEIAVQMAKQAKEAPSAKSAKKVFGKRPE